MPKKNEKMKFKTDDVVIYAQQEMFDDALSNLIGVVSRIVGDKCIVYFGPYINYKEVDNGCLELLPTVNGVYNGKTQGIKK